MKNLFALMAGGPLQKHAPENPGAPGGAPADEGGGKNPPATGDFDKGYGKGVDKGQREVLAALGIKTLDEAKAIAKQAADAAEAQRKAAEKNGEFQNLYQQRQQELDALKPEHAAYKAAYESQMDALTKELPDDDKALIAGLPPDKALAMAQRLSQAGKKPAPAGAPAGGTGTPADRQGSGGHDLAWFAKKGVSNLSKEERVEMEALMAANSPTFEEFAAQNKK